jgi:hypothetical protein
MMWFLDESRASSGGEYDRAKLNSNRKQNSTICQNQNFKAMSVSPALLDDGIEKILRWWFDSGSNFQKKFMKFGEIKMKGNHASSERTNLSRDTI